GLPPVPELRDRSLLAVGDEDRVVAEALASGRPFGDAALERAPAPQLAPVRREEDELRHVACAALLESLELAQELRHRRRALGCVARREDAGPAAERVDLEPRVLCENPARLVRTAERGFDPCVLVVRCPRLRRVVIAFERLDRPAGQEVLELTRLVRVPRAEDGFHSIQRTSSTPSTSATPATNAGAAEPAASSRSTATDRRSPSCATSSETRRPPCRSIASMIGTGLPPAGISTSRD